MMSRFVYWTSFIYSISLHSTSLCRATVSVLIQELELYTVKRETCMNSVEKKCSTHGYIYHESISESKSGSAGSVSSTGRWFISLNALTKPEPGVFEEINLLYCAKHWTSLGTYNIFYTFCIHFRVNMTSDTKIRRAVNIKIQKLNGHLIILSGRFV